MGSISKKLLICRCCSGELTEFLNLGMTPLANNLENSREESLNAVKLPLIVMYCDDCGLYQLSEIVNPDVLFKYYTYRSSVNKGYVDHCTQMAHDLKNEYHLDENTFHLDIAGNDGALLIAFRDVLNHKTLNIDPASNLCEIARKNGIESISDYWSKDIAKDLKCDLITATNVFAHLDDVTEFLEACKIALKPEGILILENPYFPNTIKTNQFDQVYFEHVSYWSLRPLSHLCNKLGLKVINIEPQSIHGGTIRYTISKNGEPKKIVFKTLIDEYKEKPEWRIKNKLLPKLTKLKQEGKSIAAFAASAKGNTLINFCKVAHLIDYISDETPEKIGKYSPGTGIPIYGIEKIMQTKPDYILILSWNFKKEIMDKINNLGFEGKFIVPIPEWQVYENKKTLTI